MEMGGGALTGHGGEDGKDGSHMHPCHDQSGL